MNRKNLTKEFIANALNEELPGINAQRTMMPEGRSLSIPKNEKKVKCSAVLLLIYPEENELKFCLTRRNQQMKHHPGQISFPGGKCEPHEINPLDTALRETEEEIGIHSSKLEIFGQLTELYVSVSNFKIFPYVAWAPQKPEFKINRIEVDQLITLPLHSILNTKNKTTKKVLTTQGKIEVPCYYIENNLIWGATSMIIAELESMLKQHYYHQVLHSNNDDIAP